MVVSAGRRGGVSPPPPPGQATQPAPGHGLKGSLPFDESEYVEVGVVSGVHGVHGELRLAVTTDEPDKRFRAGRRLFLLPPAAIGLVAPANEDALPVIQVTARGAKVRPLGKGEDAWLVGLKEVGSRTQAEHLRGYRVYCAVADRDALRDPDEFYVSDIIGCTVVHQSTGRMVGQVVDVFSGMGTHDTLRVKLRATEQDILESRIRYCMIPFAKAICPVLDLAGRTLEVDPPEGLLDIATSEPLKKPLSDDVKFQKVKQLRQQLKLEEAQLAEKRQRKKQEQQQQQQQQHASTAPQGPGQEQEGTVATATVAKTSGEDVEEGHDEGREQSEDEEEEEEERPARARRLGRRRRPGVGGVRLGRRVQG